MKIIKLVVFATIFFIGKSVIASTFYVSLIDLITSPERYTGKNVALIGFNRDRIIYLTESAAKYRDTANSIGFSDKREGFYDYCEEAFVRITGRVERDSAGGLFLQDVKQIIALDDMKDCEASLEHEYKPNTKK